MGRLVVVTGLDHDRCHESVLDDRPRERIAVLVDAGSRHSPLDRPCRANTPGGRSTAARNRSWVNSQVAAIGCGPCGCRRSRPQTPQPAGTNESVRIPVTPGRQVKMRPDRG
jgi:hypothetical protein